MGQIHDSSKRRGGATLKLLSAALAALIITPFAGEAPVRAQGTGADLAILKTTSTTIIGPGQFVDFNLRVENNGPADAMLCVIEDPTPAGLLFHAAVVPPGWSVIAPAVGGTGLIRISRSVVSFQTVENMTITMRVASTVLADQRITNTATISSNTPDPLSSNNSSSVELLVGGGSTDNPGIYDSVSGSWFLRYSNSAGPANVTFNYGPGGPAIKAFRGDWNNDGIDTPGLFDQTTGAVFLRNSNSPGNADIVFSFGAPGSGWIPVSGDWNGDGIDSIGLYDPVNSTFYLKNSNQNGAADLVFSFGPPGGGFVPLAGDWNNDFVDSVGIYDPATGAFFLRNTNTPGTADIQFVFGAPFAQPLVGDWDGDGDDTIGIVGASTSSWFLRNSNSSGVADVVFSYGVVGPLPVAGDWNGL